MADTCVDATPESERQYNWFGPNVRNYRTGDYIVCEKLVGERWRKFKTLNVISNDYAYTEARMSCSAQAMATIGKLRVT
jgi:hypothetical protein